MENYYEILEVNQKASKEVIAKVYKILAKKYHPDTTTCDKQEAEEKFKKISEAYETLSDDEKRKQYDLELESQGNDSVSVEEFMNLKNYCIELENTLNQYSAGNFNYTNNTNYNNFSQNNEFQAQAYQDAVNQAYHDAYINNLKSMGYKIRYKQTFKQKFKNLLALIITFSILFIIFYILWNIPSTQQAIKDFFILPL